MRDDAQLSLGIPLDVVEAMEQAGRWPDLSRLEQRRPDIIAGIVWMLGRNVPVRDICDALSVGPCTVQMVAESPHLAESVVTQKSRLTSRMRLAFTLGIERQVELARDGKLPMFDLKLLHDMLQLAEGAPTQRVEHTMDPAVAAFRQVLLQQSSKREMVLPAGNVNSRAGDSARLPSGPVIDVEGDCESHD